MRLVGHEKCRVTLVLMQYRRLQRQQKRHVPFQKNGVGAIYLSMRWRSGEDDDFWTVAAHNDWASGCSSIATAPLSQLTPTGVEKIYLGFLPLQLSENFREKRAQRVDHSPDATLKCATRPLQLMVRVSPNITLQQLRTKRTA